MAGLGGFTRCGLEFRAKAMYSGVMLDNFQRGFTDEKEVIVDEYTLNALDDALVARYNELSGLLIYEPFLISGDGDKEKFEEDAVNVLVAMATVLGCTKALSDYLNDITREDECEEQK